MPTLSSVYVPANWLSILSDSFSPWSTPALATRNDAVVSPALAVQCAERLKQQGVTYLDAPVTGGTEGARAGTLTVLVGGDAATLAQVQPVLTVIGGAVHHFGPVGRGQQVKAVNQVLVAGSYAAVAEAMALGERLELPIRVIWGDRDPIAVYGIAERLCERNPRARLHTLEGVGHYPQLEAPSRVAQALEAG